MVKLTKTDDNIAQFIGFFPRNTDELPDKLSITSKMSLKTFDIIPSVLSNSDNYFELSFECEGLEKGEYEYKLMSDNAQIGRGLLIYGDYNKDRKGQTVEYNKNDKYIVYNG